MKAGVGSTWSRLFAAVNRVFAAHSYRRRNFQPMRKSSMPLRKAALGKSFEPGTSVQARSGSSRILACGMAAMPGRERIRRARSSTSKAPANRALAEGHFEGDAGRPQWMWLKKFKTWPRLR